MQINTASLIFFSPTGTTQKILYTISKGIGIERPNAINLTFPEARKDTITSVNGDIVIIGVPVYEERIPVIVKSKLETIRGNGQPAILVGVYGNIGYGIVLKELSYLAENAKFRVIGCAAFIGEHSFSCEEILVAKGRPDNSDLDIARLFGVKILEKLNKFNDINRVQKLYIPGHLPMMARILPRNRAKMFTKDPDVNSNICNQCGVCIKVCPMEAINPNTLKINSELCLRCFACVKKCPFKARKIVFRKRLLVTKVLRNKSKQRKEPTIFL